MYRQSLFLFLGLWCVHRDIEITEQVVIGNYKLPPPPLQMRK